MIYADVYGLMNTAMDTVLVVESGRLAGRGRGLQRAAVAGLLGGMYAVWTLVAGAGWALGLGGKVLVSALMVAVAYAPISLRGGAEILLWLYALAFAVAGLALGLQALTSSPGLPGLPAPVTVPVSLAAVVGAAENVRRRRARGGAASAPEVTVRVCIQGRWCTLPGLLDTGNRLVDPISGQPVVVVEAGALALPEAVRDLVQADVSGSAAPDPAWTGRLRWIPFRSVGRPYGVLLGIQPDRLVVEGPDGPREVEGVLGLSSVPLGGRWAALVPQGLAERRGNEGG